MPHTRRRWAATISNPVAPSLLRRLLYGKTIHIIGTPKCLPQLSKNWPPMHVEPCDINPGEALLIRDESTRIPVTVSLRLSSFIMHSPNPYTPSLLSVSIRVNLWANSHFSEKGLPSRLSENMPVRPLTGLGVLSDLEGNRFLKCWYWAATKALVPMMPESVKYRVR